MYYYLKGEIVLVDEDKCVIDVGGVGYEFLYVSPVFKVNQITTVYTMHIVREDDEMLIGFSSLKEKEIFSKLISVKGIGPKTAVSALRGTTIDHFIEMINNDDLKGLKKLPSIGPKAAAQIILDLKGSVKNATLEQAGNGGEIKLNKEQSDAKLVLKSLGFKAKEIDDVLTRLPDSLTADVYVQEGLKKLGNK